MGEQPEPPTKQVTPFLTESQRAIRAAILGAILGLVLALFGRRR